MAPLRPKPERSGITKVIRRLALPIILGWVGVVVVLSTAVPPLEVVGRMRSVPMSPDFAPSVSAMRRVGHGFGEYTSDSSAMTAHRYYDTLVSRLNADTTYVEHVQDLWSDPLTAAGTVSLLLSPGRRTETADQT